MSFPNDQRAKSNSFHRSAQDLKCKSGCGFYGNPEWQGYCSKCRREILQKKSRPEQRSGSRKLDRSLSDAQDSSLSLAFSKFEEKKKQQTEKKTKTLKSLFNRGNTAKDTTCSPRRDQASSEFDIPEKDVPDFLKTLPEQAAADIKKQMRFQLNQMLKSSEMSTDERSELMQDFYSIMYKRFEVSHLYQDVSPETFENLMDYMEKTLLTRLYRCVFQQISSENEEKDLALQKRIRSLNWVTPQHLDADINENHPEVRDLIDKAITHIIEMDSKKAPQEKLNSIVSCCKNIFRILLVCRGSPASADEFLSAMVYIVLKANPPLLQSNIKYITNYSISSRLMSGEGSYYFTNLCCAVSFIENLTAESLNLSKEEYDRYISGIAVPPGVNHNSEPICDGLRLFYQNLAALNELGERQEKLIAEAASLQEEMDSFKEQVSTEASQQKENFHSIKPYVIPADVDITLVPKFLRSRVVNEKAKEDILVQIDSDSSDMCNPAEPRGATTTATTAVAAAINAPLSVSLDPLADFTGIPASDPIPVSPITTSSVPVLQPPLSPVQKQELFGTSDVFVQDTCHPLKHHPAEHAQSVTFPVAVFENSALQSTDEFQTSTPTASVQAFPLGLEPLPAVVNSHIPDPLSPEATVPDESLVLPPPLEPVRVQTCQSTPEADNKNI